MYLKTSLVLEYAGKSIDEKELYRKIKEQWIEDGKKLKDIVTLHLYVKPEESKAYYVINDSLKGNIII